ncbi:MAG: beta-ketoacyl-ACP synthase II [Gemmatimonadales bacterium]
MDVTGVSITGLGMVTPIGTGADQFWAGLKARRSAVREITRFDPTPFSSHVAAEIDDFHPADHLSRKAVRRYDRFSQLGVTAARLAVLDAGLDLPREEPGSVGVMMGSALGGVAFAEHQSAVYMRDGIRAVAPTLALSVFGGAVSCNIAIEFGITGPNSTNAMSCASGTIAIGDALNVIRSHKADVMLAGGSEAPLAPLCFGAFAIIRAMSSRNSEPARASRPFDIDRDGFVMGEGAAVIVLERKDHAVARGAHIYADIVGYAVTNDAHHITAPRPDAREAARTIKLALDDAKIEPKEVAYINAHGSSTPLNDSTETLAIKTVFGAHAYRLATSGTKGYYGHPLGASGAIEASVCALSMSRGWMPPTLNLDEPGPDCDIHYLADGGFEGQPAVAISNSFGFGGINATLVFRRS